MKCRNAFRNVKYRFWRVEQGFLWYKEAVKSLKMATKHVDSRWKRGKMREIIIKDRQIIIYIF